MPHRSLFALLLTALLLPGCDTMTECSADANCAEPGATVFVGNQGSFTDQTGSVTVYDATTGQATQDAFGIANALVQNVVLDRDENGRLFVLLNFNDSFSTGRGRIDVVDLETSAVTAQIDVHTPRSAVRDAGTLWVTNLYANTVTPIDLATNAPGAAVEVGMNPEGLTMAEAGLFVANNGFGFATTVTIVDPVARTVSQTLDVGCDGPKTLGTDPEGEVWVFCTGKTVYDDEGTVVEQTDGAVVVLDGETGAEVARIALDGQLGAGALGQEAVVVPVLREAWALVGDRVVRFDTATNTQAETITPDVPAGHLLTAVAYDTVEGRLLLGAAPADFVSAGEVVFTDRQGARLGGFEAGVLPTAIAVRDDD